MILLGLGYRAQNGKDTAGEAIVQHFARKRAQLQQYYGPYTVTKAVPEARIFKFADALYKVCREEYGMTVKDPALLQQVGDGRRSEFGEYYWINKVNDALEGFDGIGILTDMRYANEAEWVKGKSGYTVEVKRLNQNGSPFITQDRDPNFVSETQLHNYNFDFQIISKSAVLTAEYAITLAEFIRGLKAQ